jgi:hypothetical protein
MIRRIILITAFAVLVGMFVPVARPLPEPPRIAPPRPPVIGSYCVVTSDAAKRRGMPQGMSMWMSMNMKNSNDSAEWACADLPNPWVIPN